MGKRKSARKPVQRIRERLTTQFSCRICNQDRSIECRMHRDQGIGELRCRSCKVHFQTPIHNLSEAVDVYSDWIDACEDILKRVQQQQPPQQQQQQQQQRQQPVYQRSASLDQQRSRPSLAQTSRPAPKAAVKKTRKRYQDEYDEDEEGGDDVDDEEDTEDEDADDEPDDEDRRFIVDDDDVEEDDESEEAAGDDDDEDRPRDKKKSGRRSTSAVEESPKELKRKLDQTPSGTDSGPAQSESATASAVKRPRISIFSDDEEEA